MLTAHAAIARAGTVWDSVLDAFAPGKSFHRASQRALAVVARDAERKYEAASQSRRTAGWIAGPGSANFELGPALPRLRARSRDLTRNNPWASKALRVITADIVGNGIVARPLRGDEASRNLIRTVWDDWAGTTACHFHGRTNFYGIQAQAQRAVVEAGEALVRLVRVESARNLPVPIQLQVLEADHIDTMKDGQQQDGNHVLQGIEFNKAGQRVAYWLFDEHPGEYYRSMMGSWVSRRVPAEEIIHLYREDRAGQVRGVPWGAACLIRLRDLDEYEDAHLLREKIAACFAAFIHDMDGSGSGGTPAQKAKLGEEKMKPGTMVELAAGKDISFGTPPLVEGFEEYVATQLRAIAAGYGTTYEALTGDLSRTNHGSARIGANQNRREQDQYTQNSFVPLMCGGVWSWFNDAAAIVGKAPIGVRVGWTTPPREMYEPKDDILADQYDVRSGFSSLSETIRERGRDPQETLEELAADMKLAKSLGLKLDSDGNNAPGQVGAAKMGRDNQDGGGEQKNPSKSGKKAKTKD